MRKWTCVLGILAAWAGLAGIAQAEVYNGDFQTGDLTGWAVSGSVDVGTADGVDYFAVFEEGNAGGLSRISQTLPANRLEIMTRNTGKPFGPAHATLVGGAVV